MAKRVLIIGGYGNFGGYIATALAKEKNIQLVIAGRCFDKASRFADTLPAAKKPEACALDIFHDLDARLADIAPDIVIHTSGPFQGQPPFVAKACIKQGCHYIDLADGREFVTAIDKLDQRAKKHGVLVVSGASSVPCLSSSLIDHYLPRFKTLASVDYGISTAQKTNRGLATTAAILSYVGKPFKTLRRGKMQDVYGWQSLHSQSFPSLGKRLLGNCDIPDLALFPKRYANLENLRFYAGLEIRFLHLGLWALSWLVRLHLAPKLDPIAAYLLRASFWFDRFGSDTSGFYMCLRGTGHDNRPKEICFELCARSGDGPFIPCTPAILLATKLAGGDLVASGANNGIVAGAMPCVGLISLEEYLAALRPLDITWRASE